MIKRIEKFGATWCQPCKIMEKTLDRLIKAYPDIEYIKRDANNEEDMPRFEEMHVKNIPHVFFFDEYGHQVIDIIGAVPYSQVADIIKDNLDTSVDISDCGFEAE